METIENNSFSVAVLKNSWNFTERAESLLFKKDQTYREHYIDAVKSVVAQFQDTALKLKITEEWNNKFACYQIGTLERSISQNTKIQMGMMSRNDNVSTYKYRDKMHYPTWIAHHLVYALLSKKKVSCECASRYPAVLTVIKTVASSLNLSTTENESENELFLIFESLS